MKKILFIFLFISYYAISQETYIYKSGGRIYENGKKINSEYIEIAHGHNNEIMKYYKSGKTKKNLGNILFYGGLITTGVGLNSIAKEGKAAGVISIAGLSATLISIPVKIGYPKRIKKAVALMNEDIKNQKLNQSYQIDTEFLSNSNGFGVKFTF